MKTLRISFIQLEKTIKMIIVVSLETGFYLIQLVVHFCNIILHIAKVVLLMVTKEAAVHAVDYQMVPKF